MTRKEQRQATFELLFEREFRLEESAEEIEAAIIARDYQDMNREVSPLKKADDAVELDTSNLTIQEAVDKVLEMIQNIVNE